MKKIIALCLSLLILGCGFTAFAADDFVSSPSGQGPSLITGVISNPSCDAHLVITPYSQRNTLDAEALAAIESAYADLSGSTDLSALNSAFASYVASLGFNGTHLAVSDLFDVDYVGCTLHDSHGSYSLNISAANLDKFVGLLHKENGVWKFVDNATVSEDKASLSFSVSNLSPFAIIVNTADGEEDLLYGDINFDGRVDSLDAAQALKHDAEIIIITGKAFIVGDVTGGGVVNSLDAAQILKYDAELITVFPVEEAEQ
ncbi:MAG: hypothetical protein IJB65_06770 [Clostridia bacterium]|nr:hypothetical protein [Clostridia bacterium]